MPRLFLSSVCHSHHFYVVNFCKTPDVEVHDDGRGRVGAVRARGSDAVVVHLFAENCVENLLFFLAIVDLSSGTLPQRPLITSAVVELIMVDKNVESATQYIFYILFSRSNDLGFQPADRTSEL